MSELKYAAAVIQTDMPNPTRRSEMRKNTRRMLELAELAVTGYQPFLPVRLVVFPEFAHAAPVYPTRRELLQHLAVPVPNEETELLAAKARELGIYIQSGSMLEEDSRYPGAVFNTTCLLGPEGVLLKYRKVYPWIPWEVHTSPHDIPDYEDEIFPVAETSIGRIGVAICYDWLFPEVLRELTARGAEILVRISAYMDPFGATPPMDWWTVVNRCRALENLAYVVAANQAPRLRHYPPFSWPGGSMIVDYDGRVVVQATPGEGEKITVGPLDIERLRHERKTRWGHQNLAHLRCEIHQLYRRPLFPGGSFDGSGDLTYEDNCRKIEEAKAQLGYPPRDLV